MEQKKTVRFDRKSNTVKVLIEEVAPIVDGGENVGSSKNKFDQEYSVEFMKRKFREMHGQRVQLEADLKRARLEGERLECLPFGDDELLELKKRLMALQDFDKKEKNKSMIDGMENSLKQVKNDLRLLEPVMKQLRK
jgi:hypothetical protein